MNIETGIAIPFRSKLGRGGKGWVEEIRKMRVGDSVLFPDHAQMKSFINTMTFCDVMQRTQKQPDGQYRVWKIGVRSEMKAKATEA